MRRLWVWLKFWWENVVKMEDPPPKQTTAPTVDEWHAFEQERREEFERALKASTD